MGETFDTADNQRITTTTIYVSDDRSWFCPERYRHAQIIAKLFNVSCVIKRGTWSWNGFRWYLGFSVTGYAAENHAVMDEIVRMADLGPITRHLDDLAVQPPANTTT